MKKGANFQGKNPEEIDFLVKEFIEILKYLRLVELKYLGQGENKTSKSLYCQTRKHF